MSMMPIEHMNIDDSPVKHSDIDHSISVWWGDPHLVKITRLRLLSDRGFPFWDVSYCWGRLDDGRNVRVTLPFHQLAKGKSISSRLYEQCVKAGVNGKRLGIYDAVSYLI